MSAAVGSLNLGALPCSPGIYALVNTSNGKRYIGSTVDLRRRLKKHIFQLERGDHWNGHLLGAWRLDSAAFHVEVLELLSRDDDIAAREQVWIDKHRASEREHGYNLSPTAGRPTHTAETRARISAAQKGRPVPESTKAALRAYNESDAARANLARMQAARKGAKHSIETRARISQVQMGRPGRKLTPEQISALQEARRAAGISAETRARMSAAKKGKPGRKLSQQEIDALRVISNARKGKPSGRTMSPDTVDKMLANRRARAMARMAEALL